MVLFMGFQKDANNLRLKVLDLEDVTEDSANYLAMRASKNPGQEELEKILQEFLENNGYGNKVQNAEIHLDSGKKTIEVKLDIGTMDYGLDFLNNDQHIVKTAKVNL